MKIIEVPLVCGSADALGIKWSSNKILDFFKEIKINEKGKSVFVDGLNISKVDLIGDLEKDFLFVYKNAFNSFGEKVFFLGGDHSVSYPLSRGFFDYCDYNGKEPCLIIFSPRPDFLDAKNKKTPSRREWLKSLIDDGFPAKNIILVGVRNSYFPELKELENLGVRRILMNDLFLDLENAADAITEFGYGREVYVSIDFNILDPVFFPAGNNFEFGGLTSREFLYLIQRISKMKNFVAADFVEINSSKDKDDFSMKFAAKVLSELI